MANNQTQEGSIHFWLRDETKEGEKRCALTPTTAGSLIQHGHKVTVEASTLRCISDSEFAKVGCKIVQKSEATWEKAPLDAIILGLKELPDSNAPLVHRHIYFAHCYKKQKGWIELLNQFAKGKGILFDMEYLVDDNLRRVAAFGKTAGFVGAAIAIKEWCLKQKEPSKSLSNLQYYENSSSLILDVQSDLKDLKGRKPVVFIMGALGRCGNGATTLAKAVGLDSDHLILWDLNETKNGGPFREILDCDVFINCIYLSSTQRIPPFITKELLSQKNKKISVIADVSCDISNPYNPLPIYSVNTTFAEPFLKLENIDDLTLCSIDNLPSLVPLESSIEYSSLLLPHLIDFGKTSVWKRAETIFNEKMKEAQQTEN